MFKLIGDFFYKMNTSETNFVSRPNEQNLVTFHLPYFSPIGEEIHICGDRSKWRLISGDGQSISIFGEETKEILSSETWTSIKLIATDVDYEDEENPKTIRFLVVHIAGLVEYV